MPGHSNAVSNTPGEPLHPVDLNCRPNQPGTAPRRDRTAPAGSLKSKAKRQSSFKRFTRGLKKVRLRLLHAAGSLVLAVCA